MKPEQKKYLKELYTKLCPDAFTYNHYDLAAVTKVKDPLQWREFLLEPDIQLWRDTELEIIHKSELMKILQDISKSNSVGQAQIVNALQKLTDDKQKTKSGPIFIYTYIPLSGSQEHAPNVVKLDKDPFLQ